ncbi:MAG: hypothetical protein J5990_03165 [Bacteroidales bacterium]|nr:hypothetical protein [Bacteroidales bacterium]
MWSLLCIPPLAAMVISDLRSRRIGTVHLIIFGITLLMASLWDSGWCQVLVNLSFNLLAVLFLSIFLYGYSRIRKMRLADMIGGGDLAFALAAMPYLEIREYVLFLISSCILTLAVWWMSGIKGKRSKDIPLVTGMGAYFGVVILYRTITVLI